MSGRGKRNVGQGKRSKREREEERGRRQHHAQNRMARFRVTVIVMG